MGIGDWGLGIGDWAQSPIPNPQSPIPNPQNLFRPNSIKLIKQQLLIFGLNKNKKLIILNNIYTQYFYFVHGPIF